MLTQLGTYFNFNVFLYYSNFNFNVNVSVDLPSHPLHLPSSLSFPRFCDANIVSYALRQLHTFFHFSALLTYSNGNANVNEHLPASLSSSSFPLLSSPPHPTPLLSF